jgi:RNA polymerase sigma-70 factor (ECF subfamily)
MRKRSDYEYFGELLKSSQMGDRTAFAELYAATYSRTYEYAYRFFDNEELAKTALRGIYAQALREIQSLRTPELFMAWLNRISFQVCNKMKAGGKENAGQEELLRIGMHTYSINQVLRLPLTESQVLIGIYYQKLTIRENARLLDISRAAVKRNLRLGRLHLRKLLGDI